MKTKEKTILENIPDRINPSEILNNIDLVTKDYLISLKTMTPYSDEVISNLYNVSVKTFRSYKNSNSKLNEDVKERTIMLLSLLKHGDYVFGSPEKFKDWLESENFYFGKKAPKTYLTTINGIQYIDDRLTAMQYGDNV